MNLPCLKWISKIFERDRLSIELELNLSYGNLYILKRKLVQKGFNDLVQLYLRRVDLKYPFRECGNLIGRNFWQLNPACLQWFSSTYSDEGGFKISVSRMAQSDWSKFLAIKSGLKGISVNLYVIYLYVSAWDTPWISRLGQFLGIMRTCTRSA